MIDPAQTVLQMADIAGKLNAENTALRRALAQRDQKIAELEAQAKDQPKGSAARKPPKPLAPKSE